MGQVSDPDDDLNDELTVEDDDVDIALDGLPDEPLDGEEHRTPDGKPLETDEDRPVDDVVIDLTDWSTLEHDAVTRRLVDESIPHHWDGLKLVVARSDDDRTQAVLDEVGGTGEPLDPDVDQVAYDLTEWDDDRLVALGETLEDEEIPFDWDGDELFVYAEDEQMVDELLDKVSHPDELDAEEDDGDGGAELLGELFVAADRLQHDPDNHETCVILIDLANVVKKASAPYGLAPKEWDRISERVGDLSSLLKELDPDENSVLAAARDLRDAVRRYV